MTSRSLRGRSPGCRRDPGSDRLGAGDAAWRATSGAGNDVCSPRDSARRVAPGSGACVVAPSCGHESTTASLLACAGPGATPAWASAAQTPTRAQVRRLREVYRSAGWPCQDTMELELLAAGWLCRERDADGRERLRLTDAGVQPRLLAWPRTAPFAMRMKPWWRAPPRSCSAPAASPGRA